MMRAAVVDRYGPPEVVRIAEVPRPTPRSGEVLVRVQAAALTSADARMRAGRFPKGFAVLARLAVGLSGPRHRILGSAFSGVVEAVGGAGVGLAPGDEVCGMTGGRLGAHAGYVAVPASRLVRKPPRVSHDEAAGVLFGGTTALFFLRDKARVAAGARVLVNGASGAVGTCAVQLARHFGAAVTAVCSAANAGLAARLGAEEVVDYARTDLATLERRFDAVLDAVGNLTIPAGRKLLREGGILLLAVPSLGDLLRARGDVVAGEAPQRTEDFALLLELVANGKLQVVCDRTYDLDQVREAHRHVDGGRKRGNDIVHPWPSAMAVPAGSRPDART